MKKSITSSTKSLTPKKKVMTKAELEQGLIDNFINMQKVLTNLSIKFDDLSTNISKLLQLFEISAKSFAEKYSEEESNPNNAINTKLDSLTEQNKIIAKGIMLIEERVRGRNSPALAREESRFKRTFRSNPLPRH